MKLNIHYHY